MQNHTHTHTHTHIHTYIYTLKVYSILYIQSLHINAGKNKGHQKNKYLNTSERMSKMSFNTLCGLNI